MEESRLAVIERDLVSLAETIKNMDVKQEHLRDKIHERLNVSHNLYNILRRDAFDAISENTKDISNIEQNVQNIDKIVDKFVIEIKAFVREITGSVSKLEKALDRRKTKNEVWKDIGVFILKLGSFAVTMIAILKYIEKL